MATWVLSINFTCIFHSELLNSVEEHGEICERGRRRSDVSSPWIPANVGFVEAPGRTHVLGI